MAQLLKYMGKGEWREIDSSEVTALDKVRFANESPTKRIKSSKEDKILTFFESVRKDIQKNGYR